MSLTAHQWSLVAPAAILLATIPIVLFGGLTKGDGKRPTWLPWGSFLGTFAAGVLLVQALLAPGTRPWLHNYHHGALDAGLIIFEGSFAVDSFGIAMGALITLCTAAAVLLAAKRAGENTALSSGEYFALFPLTALGLFLMVCAHDFLTLVICLEIASISVYILTASKRESRLSNEAALKYLILGGFGSALLLMGVAFFYGATGTLELNAVKTIDGRESLAVLSLGLMLAGLMFKLGAAPFQFWVPDVYHGAPTATTAFMASAVKIGALAVPLRLCFETFGLSVIENVGDQAWRYFWVEPIRWMAVLTMIWGNVLAIRQENVKRMLAYSAIAHSGYLLVALPLSASAQPADAIAQCQNAVFYLLVYAAATVGSFGVVALTRKNDKPLETFADFKGLANKKPLLALCMAVFMLSLAGMPPFGGFVGKFMLFRGAAQQGEMMLVIVGVLTSVVSLYYYLRVVGAMYMPEREDAESLETREAVQFDWRAKLVLYGAGAALVVFGILPNLVLDPGQFFK